MSTEENTSFSSPSKSEIHPFDWAAARGERPPPYGAISGIQQARRRARQSTANGNQPKSRVVRRASLWYRLTNYPSHLWFELTLIPQNAPLPPPKVIGHSVGLICHVLHWCVSWMDRPPSDDLGSEWSDMRTEMGDGLDGGYGYGFWWFLGWCLFFGSIANMLYLFTRFKSYHLHLRTDPLQSPNAKVVRKDLHLEYQPDPPLVQWLLMLLGRQIRESWRFLMGSSLPDEALEDHQANVQQLDIWTPSEFSLAFASIYSPVHSMLYSVFGWHNWMRVPAIMVSLTAMLHAFVSWYEQLIKDRLVLSSEVMYEYNEKFVNPRLNPIRKDACVMTNEAETVDYHLRETPNGFGYRRHPRTSMASSVSARHLNDYSMENSPMQNGSPLNPVNRRSMGGAMAKPGLLRF